MRTLYQYYAAICLSISLGNLHAEENKPLMLGVLNQQSPQLTAERWNPILNYLSKTTGFPFQLKMGQTVQVTDAMMGRGEFDLVFTNHNFQVEYDGVYKVIARWSGEPIRGVIAVQPDSNINQLYDLKDKKIAFPSKDAFVAYAVPKVALNNEGIKVNVSFAGNQEGALAQLKAKMVDAVAVNSRLLKNYTEQQNIQFREIFVSEPFAELPIIVHPRLPSDKVEIIQKALLNMKNDPNAAEILKKLKFKGFEAAEEKDYDNVRKVYRQSEQ
jgi:phosphonate transport system substrate-binding protein